jgi:hypothetical protein
VGENFGRFSLRKASPSIGEGWQILPNAGAPQETPDEGKMLGDELGRFGN